MMSLCMNSAMKDPVTFAVAQCPFLAKVAAQNGPEYARSIAVNPTEAAGAPEGPDSVKQYEASFQLFHGPSGIVPLVQTGSSANAEAGGGCPFYAHRAAAAAASEASSDCVTSSKPLPRTLPLATISLSFGSGSNFGDFLRNKLHNKQPNSKRPSQQQRQPPSNSSHLPNSSSNGSGLNPTSNNPTGANSGSSFKPQRPLGDPSISSSSNGGAFGPSSSNSTGFRGPGGPRQGMGFSSGGPQPPATSATASGATANPTANPPTAPTGGSHTAAGGPGSHSGLGSMSGLGSGSSTAFNGFGSSASSAGGINGPGTAASPFKGFSSSSNSNLTGGNNARSGSSVNSGSSSRFGNGSGGPARGPKPPGSSSSRIANSSAGSAAPAPACPLRKWLGPMAGLVFNDHDKLICPPPIVAARAALAKTAAVQQLRPQKLPVKLVAVAAVAAAANLPCGAVREHFEKFSVGWFIAVHATIPFVAMLRKAVIMPKYSIMVTIASAVIGQMVGSRLERARLQQQAAAAAGLALEPGAFPAAAAAAAASTPASSSSATSKLDSKKLVRDSAWCDKILAGGKAGFGDDHESAAAAAAACGSVAGDTGASKVVGLGSFLPRLPVVRA